MLTCLQCRPVGWEDPLEEGMATHSSILAWETPRTDEAGRGSQRAGHNRATNTTQSNNYKKRSKRSHDDEIIEQKTTDNSEG